MDNGNKKKIPLEASMMKRIGELNADIDRLRDRHGELCADNARLKAEVERLKQQVDYWRIESDCNHGRWLRCLEDLEHLRASSFVTAVPSEQYERVIKAGDAVCESPYLWETDPAVIEWRNAKNGGQP
jgi:regulator of replication initiation timing